MVSSDDGSARTAVYSSTSTSVNITTQGVNTLSTGKAYVKFDESYSKLISSKKPIVVTITPMGNTNGVYIESVDQKGFVVVENNDGKSNVNFNWSAVAERVGYEDYQPLEELKNVDYDKNMSGVMFNDLNSKEKAQPVWWDGSKLRFDAIPKISNTSVKLKMKK
jgi:hypothetical protein